MIITKYNGIASFIVKKIQEVFRSDLVFLEKTLRSLEACVVPIYFHLHTEEFC